MCISSHVHEVTCQQFSMERPAVALPVEPCRTGKAQGDKQLGYRALAEVGRDPRRGVGQGQYGQGRCDALIRRANGQSSALDADVALGAAGR